MPYTSRQPETGTGTAWHNVIPSSVDDVPGGNTRDSASWREKRRPLHHIKRLYSKWYHIRFRSGIPFDCDDRRSPEEREGNERSEGKSLGGGGGASLSLENPPTYIWWGQPRCAVPPSRGGECSLRRFTRVTHSLSLPLSPSLAHSTNRSERIRRMQSRYHTRIHSARARIRTPAHTLWTHAPHTTQARARARTRTPRMRDYYAILRGEKSHRARAHAACRGPHN